MGVRLAGRGNDKDSDFMMNKIASYWRVLKRAFGLRVSDINEAEQDMPP